MKISIVTISFNQSEFLERAIRSIIEQDYDDIEYIVVDPGSTDGSRDIIEKYRDRISKIIFEPDQGPADGLNKGFSQATGDIFGYMNADDAYLPGTFRKVIAAFQHHSEADVIYGHGYMVDAAGRILRRFYSDRFSPWLHVHGGAVVMQQSTFFRKQAFVDVGGFNPENPIWWDGELLVDFALAGKQLAVINELMSIFTIHERSISGQRGKDTDRANRLALERKRTLERLYNKVMGHPINFQTNIWMIVARIKKWMFHPMIATRRLGEKVGLHFGDKIIKI